ncbi:hypothetical protein [Runella sp. MFBS21]|nr:hypothetical protein [Runella sp. MFBS21]
METHHAGGKPSKTLGYGYLFRVPPAMLHKKWHNIISGNCMIA